MGNVEIRITRGFADEGEAGFFDGGDVFGVDLDEESAGRLRLCVSLPSFSPRVMARNGRGKWDEAGCWKADGM